MCTFLQYIRVVSADKYDPQIGTSTLQ